MASRHTQHNDQQHRRLSELRFMMGTGAGIQRVPAKIQTIVAQLAQHKGSAAPFIWPGIRRLDVLDGEVSPFLYAPQDFVTRRAVATVIEHYDVFDGVPMETDMGHYWQLAKEKRELETNLKLYVPGYQFIAGKSPFGPDRFRKFDPLPAFETIIAHGPFAMRVICC